MAKTKNDDAWEALFEEYNILQAIAIEGFYKIDASAINKKREARLMTKFDHLINLPEIFRDNDLTILPASRSSYIIGTFDCYAKIQQDNDSNPTGFNFRDDIESISPDNLYSESSALLCAYHAGLITDVLEEKMRFTVFGRMSTGTFDFSIATGNKNALANQILKVDKAQCEIDGAFEGETSFAIIEVKNEEVEDFHIRQLYFPYRVWRERLNKKVIPIFLTYSNEIFTFSVYEFENPNDYNSLTLVKRKRYQLVPTEIEIADIRHILSNNSIKPEPKSIPFPQADRLERIIDLLVHLYSAGGIISQDDITTRYAFNIRQTQYYAKAGNYLGLIERIASKGTGVSYTLTESGFTLMQKAPRARNLDLIKLILQHSVFHDAMEYYLSHSCCPTSHEISRMMQQAGMIMSKETRERRSQTVTGWLKWIINLTTEE